MLKVGQDGWWKQDSALRAAGGRHEGCTPMLCTPSVSSILRVLSQNTQSQNTRLLVPRSSSSNPSHLLLTIPCRCSLACDTSTISSTCNRPDPRASQPAETQGGGSKVRDSWAAIWEHEGVTGQKHSTRGGPAARIYPPRCGSQTPRCPAAGSRRRLRAGRCRAPAGRRAPVARAQLRVRSAPCAGPASAKAQRARACKPATVPPLPAFFLSEGVSASNAPPQENLS